MNLVESNGADGKYELLLVSGVGFTIGADDAAKVEATLTGKPGKLTVTALAEQLGGNSFKLTINTAHVAALVQVVGG